MKKVKVKLDMDQVKLFFIEHGEKFGLAVFVLILGMSIVKAVSRETLPDNLSPKAISDNSSRAQSTVTGTAKPPTDQDVKPENFVAEVLDEAKLSVPPGEQNPQRIGYQAFPPPITRVDPTLFKVEELRVYPFRGALPILPPPNVGANQAPAAGPAAAAAPPAGGLIPGRVAPRPAGRGNVARPPAVAPAQGLAGGAAAPQGPQNFPQGFVQPGPQGAGFAEGKYGIVVTGLVPEQAQREEYERRFKNARRAAMAEGENNGGRQREGEGLAADTPKYVWCVLERTDLTDGKTVSLDFGDEQQIRQDINQSNEELGKAAKAQVSSLHIRPNLLHKLQADEKQWAVPPQEVADPAFLMEKYFTWGLPPILLRVWGAEAAHLPQVPLAGNPNAGGAQQVIPDNGQKPDDAFGGGAAGAAPGRVPAPGQMRRHIPDGLPPMRAPGNEAQLAQEVPYKLFRYVDLDVEPGHSYKYRVQMLVRNPNFGLEAQVLLKPETAMVAYRPTPWSDSSPAASVPEDTRLLGGGIKRELHKEAKAKVSVFTFDVKQAIELIKEFDTELGALVGTTDTDQTIKGVADPVQRMIRDITADFRTPSVLLDLRGNEEKLPGVTGITDPAEMLLIDDIDHPESMRLIVVNEAKDKPTIDEWRQTHIPPAVAAAPAPGLGPNPAKPGPEKKGGLLPPAGPTQRGNRGPAR